MHFFLTIQFVSFSKYYGVELPTIPSIILEEMQNLVMLDMFKPDKIFVLMKSLKNKIQTKRSFIEIYE